MNSYNLVYLAKNVVERTTQYAELSGFALFFARYGSLLMILLLPIVGLLIFLFILSRTKKRNRAKGAPDEIKKYHDLLSSGAITQEEFDAKKKQLLGL